jgi:hypothetical protein
MYANINQVPKYLIELNIIDLKGEIGSNTIMVVDVNTTLSPMDRSTRQKKIN